MSASPLQQLINSTAVQLGDGVGVTVRVGVGVGVLVRVGVGVGVLVRVGVTVGVLVGEGEIKGVTAKEQAPRPHAGSPQSDTNCNEVTVPTN